jgi:uncharacterized protein YjgD (DUF1641 family)
MAKAIAIVPVPSQSQQGAIDEINRKLAAAPVEHAEALLKLYGLLEMANDKKVLDIATGVLSSSDYILTKLAEASKNESSIQAMRNGIMMLEMLGSLDPEVLHSLVKALPNGLSQANEIAVAQKPPSAWKSLRGFMSEDGRRMLGFASTLVVALGAALGPKKKH